MGDDLDRDLQQVFDESFVRAARFKEAELIGRPLGRPSRESLHEVKREARLRRRARREAVGQLVVDPLPVPVTARPFHVAIGFALLLTIVLVASLMMPGNRPSSPGPLSARFQTGSSPGAVAAKPQQPTVEDVDAVAVSVLFTGLDQAWGVNPRQGLAFELSHDYPGSVRPAAFRECAAADVARLPNRSESFAPEMSTLVPIPVWIGDVRGQAARDWAFGGRRPAGNTYLMIVDWTTAVPPDGEPVTVRESLPVTVLDGVAYLYLTAC